MGHPSNEPDVPNGNYEINVGHHGGNDSDEGEIVRNQGVLDHFADGIQNVSDMVFDKRGSGNYFNAQTEWGTMRANLSHGPGWGTKFYLHGRTKPGDMTAGCVGERDEKVLKAIFNLNPLGVGEGNKNGRIAVSVGGGH
jgi:hypothetical protein